MNDIIDIKEWAKLIESQIDKTAYKVKVLDLGCGTGIEIDSVVKQLKKAEITCIDISKEMLNELERKYRLMSSQLKLIHASYLDIDLGESEYDYVIACETMHHWEYDIKIKLYRNIYRAIKIGGRYIEVDYIVPSEVESKMAQDYYDIKDNKSLQKGEYYHIDIPFSVRTEIKVLKEAGFNIVEVIKEEYNEKSNTAMVTAIK